MAWPRRYKLLKDVIRYIDEGHYDDYEGHWAFGEGRGEPPESTDEEALQQIEKLISEYVAQLAAQQRTSIARPAKMNLDRFREHIEKLSPATKEDLQAALRDADNKDPRTGEVIDDIDHLDRFYADELVTKLESVVRRAAQLDKLIVGALPNRHVQAAFAEAHHCYLYGFHLASVTFCRAILESALKEIVGHKGELHTLINVAKESKVLRDQMVEYASNIATAGNLAIHEPEKFGRRYPPDKVQELLIKTRAILEDLYSLPDK